MQRSSLKNFITSKRETQSIKETALKYYKSDKSSRCGIPGVTEGERGREKERLAMGML